MRILLPIINFFALIILLYEFMTLNTIMNAFQQEFDTRRLETAIKYSTRAAFQDTVQYTGDIGISYLDPDSVRISASTTLDSFETMMCYNYGFSTSEENKKHVENFIAAACIAGFDGYYDASWVLKRNYIGTEAEMTDAEKAALDSKIQSLAPNERAEMFDYELTFGLKKPYAVPLMYGNDNNHTIGAVSVNLVNENYTVVGSYNDGENLFIDKGIRTTELASSLSSLSSLLGGKHVSPLYSVTNAGNRYGIINSILTGNLIYQIGESAKIHQSTEYRVYLPGTQTVSGINAIDTPTLLIIMQGADFAGEAKIEDAITEGLKIIRKIRVITYEYLHPNAEHEAGKRYYCYETQLGDEMLEDVKIYDYFSNIDLAALGKMKTAADGANYADDDAYPDLPVLKRQIDTALTFKAGTTTDSD